MSENKIDYNKEFEHYSVFYDLCVDLGPGKPPRDIEHISLAFMHCIAMAARLSYGTSDEKAHLSLSFCNLADRLMFLGGLHECPNDTPFISSSIRQNACRTLVEIAYSENRSITEKEIEFKIIKNFDKIAQFSGFKFIKNQKRLRHGDAIDIYAVEEETDRPVIIEIKKKNVSGHKQLRSYAVGFTNPLLINISEAEVATKRDDISYYTLKDLLPNKEQNG